LGESVGANAYLTPSNAQGFDIHYDNHCAIVIQLHGTKNWSIFAPLHEMPLARCERPIPLEELGQSLLCTQLMTGDVLYIPRGFPHYALTEGDTSLHLTLSLRPITWAEVVQAFCHSDAALRRSVRLSNRGLSSVQQHFTRDILPRFAGIDAELIAERLAAEQLAKSVPMPSGGLRALETAKGLTSNAGLFRAPQVRCTATVEGTEAVLRFPGSSLRLPVAMKPVFEFVAAHEEFTPDMLPGIEPGYDRIHLVEILIKRGLLRVQEPVAPGISTKTSDAVAEVV
jgi:hypothetical protein